MQYLKGKFNLKLSFKFKLTHGEKVALSSDPGSAAVPLIDI